MEPSHLPDVLYRQFLSCLKAEDRLVLGTVVHEHALDILHAGHQEEVAKEYRYLEYPFYQSFDPVYGQYLSYETRDHGGQQNEERDGQESRQYRGDQADSLVGLLPEMLLKPLVELVFLIPVGKGDVGGSHDKGISRLQRQVHSDDSSQDRDVLEGIGRRLGYLGADISAGFSHCETCQSGTLHGDPFYDCLSADGSFETHVLLLRIRLDRFVERQGKKHGRAVPQLALYPYSPAV